MTLEQKRKQFLNREFIPSKVIEADFRILSPFSIHMNFSNGKLNYYEKTQNL